MSSKNRNVGRRPLALQQRLGRLDGDWFALAAAWRRCTAQFRTEGYPLPTRPRRPGDGPPAGQHRRAAALAGAMPSPAARRLKVIVVPVFAMSRAVRFAHFWGVSVCCAASLRSTSKTLKRALTPCRGLWWVSRFMQNCTQQSWATRSRQHAHTPRHAARQWSMARSCLARTPQTCAEKIQIQGGQQPAQCIVPGTSRDARSAGRRPRALRRRARRARC